MIDESIRVILVAALVKLASSAETQRASDFPPEELRLEWEDAFALAESWAEEGRSGPFDPQMEAVRAFDAYLWSVPAECDPIWHRDNLDEQPWPTIRAKAADLLAALRQPLACSVPHQ